jgi:hypothetical protein
VSDGVVNDARHYFSQVRFRSSTKFCTSFAPGRQYVITLASGVEIGLGERLVCNVEQYPQEFCAANSVRPRASE